jgi:Bacterial pre-peptidase C-terminal domain
MIRFPFALATAALLLFAPMAGAAGESGDAGELPAGAQDLSAEGVTQIDGSFATQTDVDMYKLCLPGGGSFSASTVGGTLVDTQLFLFDSAGLGVYGNDDDGSSRQSTLPAGHQLTPQAAGEYYLAVAPFNRDPNSVAGPIFPALAPVLAPTGPGAAQPVSGWSGRVSGLGPYRVSVTGASCRAPDTTAPTIDLRSPLDGALYLLDDDVAADYGCADEPGGSGLASCVGTVPDGAPLDTGSVGEKSFRVDAADAAGNTAVARSVYRVIYDFEGFLWPVRNRPATNRWPAGLPVPIRFELGGYHGRDVIEEGWPQVAKIECGSGDEPASGKPARHPRWFRELVYRKHRARYVFLWRTKRHWAGGCRQFLLRLSDGTLRRADFEFVRPRDLRD